MPEILGIDFGTQYLRAAVWDAAGPRMLTDAAYPKFHALLPTAVTQKLEWGWTLPPGKRKFPLKKLLYLMSETEFLKIEQLKKVLPLFLNDACMRIQYPKASVVVTIPATFSEEGKQLLLKACHDAGLNPLDALPEAEAVCLAYTGLKKKSGIAAVWTLGAGFSEMLLAEIGSSGIKVIASESLEIGGYDFDRVIVSALIGQMTVSKNIKDEEKFLAYLEEEARKAKESLSVKGSYDFKVHSKDWGFSFNKAMSRFEMGEILQPFFHKIENAWRRLLKTAALEPSAVGEVLIAGGCSRMPFVADVAKNVFNRKVQADIHPEEVAVFGALLHARGLGGKMSAIPITRGA